MTVFTRAITNPYPETSYFIPYLSMCFLNIHFNIMFQYCLDLPSSLFISDPLTKILHAFLITHTHNTHSHLSHPPSLLHPDNTR